MVTLRQADAADLPILTALFDADRALQMAPQPIGSPVSRARILSTLAQMIQSGGLSVVDLEGQAIGAVCALVMPSLWSEDALCWLCLFYLAPIYRRHSRATLRAFEQTLVDSGVTRLVVSVPDSPDAAQYERFYRQRGYTRLETQWMKPVGRRAGA